MPPHAASCPGSTGRRSATSAPPAVLDASARATRAIPAVEHAEAARTQEIATRAEEAAAGADLAGLGVALDADTLRATRDDALASAAQATALLPREERLVGLRRQVETYAARIAQLDSELVSHETTLARLPERLERCRADHRAAAAAVAALPGAESALEDLHKRVVRRGPARRAPAPAGRGPRRPVGGGRRGAAADRGVAAAARAAARGDGGGDGRDPGGRRRLPRVRVRAPPPPGARSGRRPRRRGRAAGPQGGRRRRRRPGTPTTSTSAT